MSGLVIMELMTFVTAPKKRLVVKLICHWRPNGKHGDAQ